MAEGDHAQAAALAAENFGASLDDVFALNSDPLQGLSQSVEEKKRTVSSRSEELAAIETRLRETEERLARAAREKQISGVNDRSSENTHQSSLQQAYSGAEPDSNSNRLAQTGGNTYSNSAPSGLKHATGGPRPGNDRVDSIGELHMPGAMPETPPVYATNDYTTAQGSR